MTDIDRLSIDIAVVLGTAMVPIHQLLKMGRGAVIELDSTEHDDVKILANNVPVARGQVKVVDTQIGVEITEMLPPNRAGQSR